MTLTKTIQNPRKSLKCLHELSRAIKIIYADQYSEEGSALVSVQGSEALFCYQKNLWDKSGKFYIKSLLISP